MLCSANVQWRTHTLTNWLINFKWNFSLNWFFWRYSSSCPYAQIFYVLQSNNIDINVIFREWKCDSYSLNVVWIKKEKNHKMIPLPLESPNCLISSNLDYYDWNLSTHLSCYIINNYVTESFWYHQIFK